MMNSIDQIKRCADMLKISKLDDMNIEQRKMLGLFNMLTALGYQVYDSSTLHSCFSVNGNANTIWVGKNEDKLLISIVDKIEKIQSVDRVSQFKISDIPNTNRTYTFRILFVTDCITLNTYIYSKNALNTNNFWELDSFNLTDLSEKDIERLDSYNINNIAITNIPASLDQAIQARVGLLIKDLSQGRISNKFRSMIVSPKELEIYNTGELDRSIFQGAMSEFNSIREQAKRSAMAHKQTETVKEQAKEAREALSPETLRQTIIEAAKSEQSLVAEQSKLAVQTFINIKDFDNMNFLKNRKLVKLKITNSKNEEYIIDCRSNKEFVSRFLVEFLTESKISVGLLMLDFKTLGIIKGNKASLVESDGHYDYLPEVDITARVGMGIVPIVKTLKEMLNKYESTNKYEMYLKDKIIAP